MNMNFLLPDRYEGLNETAGNKDGKRSIGGTLVDLPIFLDN